MPGGIISWWTRNPVAANLAMVVIIIAGIVAFIQINREIEPHVQAPGAQISVYWPGASPRDVEEQLVLRMEEAVADIQGLDDIWAVANEGSGILWVVAEVDVNTQSFLDEVKSEIDSISSFPDAAERPVIRQFRSTQEMMRVAVTGDVDIRTLNRTAELIRRDIGALSSIPSVGLFGNVNEEVSIEPSEEQLQRFGLSFSEVAAAIRASSLNRSAGRLRTEVGDVPVNTRKLADTQAEFENIVIRQTPDGGVVRVGDVATVRDGFEEVNLQARMNGKPAVLVQILSGPNMHVPQMSRDVRAYLEEARSTMPPGVELIIWDDAADVYNDRMKTIFMNFGTGLLLVLIVLVLFLRPIVAFWVAIGIAVAFAGGLAMLPLSGVSFNMISTFAFLLVIGVVVDDAIIVGEAIHSRTERGESGSTAAVHGTQLVLKPVIFAVLTTIIFFAPWMFFSGVTSQYTRAISLVVIWCLLFSLIEALWILPAHLAHLKPVTNPRGFMAFQKRLADSIVWFGRAVYRPFMAGAIRHRYITAAVFVGGMIISIGFAQAGWVKFNFMPEIQGDQVSIRVELPEGTPFSRSLEVLQQLENAEKRLLGRAEELGEKVVENWYTRVRENSSTAIVQLTEPSERQWSASEVADILREEVGEIPDAEDVSVDFTLNDTGPPLQFVLHAREIEDLRVASEELKTHLRSYPSVFAVVDDIEAASDELRIDLRPGAERFGVTLSDVSRQVSQCFFGEEVQRLPRDGQDVRVYVRCPKEDRQSLEQLNRLRIRTPDGRELPLSAVADLDFAPGVKFILRRDRQRAATIDVDLPSDEAADVRRDLEENFWAGFDARHPGVTRGFIGESQEQQRFMEEFVLFMIIAIGVAYVLVAIAFRSYAQPLLILLAAIPFCTMGGILGHFAMGYSLSLMSILGIIAAAGVAVNDNLVLIDYVNRLRAQGMGGARALVEAGTARFRPILLTSVTTFIGLVPLMLEQSIQAAWLIPVAIGLAFGVICALFVTLFFVPSLYAIGADIKRYVVYAAKGGELRVFGSSLEDQADQPDITDQLVDGTPAE